MHTTKTLALTLAAAAVLAAGFAGAVFGGSRPEAQAAPIAVAVVDFSRILNEHKGLAARQSELENVARQSQEKLDRMMEELEQLRDGLVVYAQGSKERIQKEQEIERKRLEFDQQGRLLQLDLDARKTQILKDAVVEIEETVARYGRDHGLDAILAAPFSITNVKPKDATDVLKWLNSASVIWSNDALDITGAVLTIVNGS